MVTIRHEKPSDIAAREALLDDAFGSGRAAKTAERLREGRQTADGLSFTAAERGRVVGTVRLWHIVLGQAQPALLLGPLAVAADRRNRGIGAALMRHALRAAQQLGHGAVLLVGDAPYYGRFGFRQALTERLTLPGPVERERFLGLELRPGALEDAHGAVIASGAWETARTLRRLMPYPSTPTRLRASAGRS
jgi:predicted N-acetyltransferase YhbS